MKQIGFFDHTTALAHISSLGDKLEWLNEVVDWSIFSETLDRARPDRTKTEKGGRPPLPNLLMFKCIILQELHGVSDEQAEFQINDRLTWRRFLGLSLSDKAPDRTSIWEFRELLKAGFVYDELFELFNAKMESLGVITRKGSILDASFIDVPRQRNTREENKTIKEGGVPEAWQDAPHKLSQKDTDAAWAKKNEEVHFGYKDHVLADADSKMITDYHVTAANLHDSKLLHAFMSSNTINELWMDSAYMSKEILAYFEQYHPHIKLHINEKGSRGHPLTDEQKLSNKEKSRIRVLVEHIFGHITNSMGGMFIRCIGEERAECSVCLKNLAYNISRYATLRKLKRAPSMA
jgi:IS5 family transposase